MAVPVPPSPPVAVVFDERCLLHVTPYERLPEQATRILAIFHRLRTHGALSADRVRLLPARLATDDDLLAVHPAEYLRRVDALDGRGDGVAAMEGGRMHLDAALARRLHVEPGAMAALVHHLEVELDIFDWTITADNDTYAGPHTPAAARLAAGGLLVAVDALMGPGPRSVSALTILRPPGHHCFAARGGGFCFFNSVAIAAAYARRCYGVRRIAIVDWDVHHGNGTQEIVQRGAGDDTLFISLHRHDDGTFYPGASGAVDSGGDSPMIVNIAWPGPGVGDAEYTHAFARLVVPVVHEFAPELILVSSGFDAAMGDPLGGLEVSPLGYYRMTRMLAALDPPGGIIVALEGGYNLNSIAACAEAVTAALHDAAPSSRRRRSVPVAGAVGAAAVPAPSAPLPLCLAPLPPTLNPGARHALRETARHLGRLRRWACINASLAAGVFEPLASSLVPRPLVGAGATAGDAVDAAPPREVLYSCKLRAVSLCVAVPRPERRAIDAMAAAARLVPSITALVACDSAPGVLPLGDLLLPVTVARQPSSLELLASAAATLDGGGSSTPAPAPAPALAAVGSMPGHGSDATPTSVPAATPHPADTRSDGDGDDADASVAAATAAVARLRLSGEGTRRTTAGASDSDNLVTPLMAAHEAAAVHGSGTFSAASAASTRRLDFGDAAESPATSAAAAAATVSLTLRQTLPSWRAVVGVDAVDAGGDGATLRRSARHERRSPSPPRSRSGTAGTAAGTATAHRSLGELIGVGVSIAEASTAAGAAPTASSPGRQHVTAEVPCDPVWRGMGDALLSLERIPLPQRGAPSGSPHGVAAASAADTDGAPVTTGGAGSSATLLALVLRDGRGRLLWECCLVPTPGERTKRRTRRSGDGGVHVVPALTHAVAAGAGPFDYPLAANHSDEMAASGELAWYEAVTGLTSHTCVPTAVLAGGMGPAPTGSHSAFIVVPTHTRHSTLPPSHLPPPTGATGAAGAREEAGSDDSLPCTLQVESAIPLADAPAAAALTALALPASLPPAAAAFAPPSAAPPATAAVPPAAGLPSGSPSTRASATIGEVDARLGPCAVCSGVAALAAAGNAGGFTRSLFAPPSAEGATSAGGRVGFAGEPPALAWCLVPEVAKDGERLLKRMRMAVLEVNAAAGAAAAAGTRPVAAGGGGAGVTPPGAGPTDSAPAPAAKARSAAAAASTGTRKAGALVISFDERGAAATTAAAPTPSSASLSPPSVTTRDAATTMPATSTATSTSSPAPASPTHGGRAGKGSAAARPAATRPTPPAASAGAAAPASTGGRGYAVAAAPAARAPSPAIVVDDSEAGAASDSPIYACVPASMVKLPERTHCIAHVAFARPTAAATAGIGSQPPDATICDAYISRFCAAQRLLYGGAAAGEGVAEPRVLHLPVAAPRWRLSPAPSDDAPTTTYTIDTAASLAHAPAVVLTARGEDSYRQIASITKCLTYIVVVGIADALREVAAGSSGSVAGESASGGRRISAPAAASSASNPASYPAGLDTLITVSKRAAAVVGGTVAEVAAGETLTAWDLLHGMMLPSGNDAATALAEHYGAYCAPVPEADWRPFEAAPHYECGSWGRLDAVARFVAEMNRAATALGMAHSRFANPHGMYHVRCHSTALDVARLVSAAMADPRFAAVVATRTLACEALKPDAPIPTVRAPAAREGGDINVAAAMSEGTAASAREAVSPPSVAEGGAGASGSGATVASLADCDEAAGELAVVAGLGASGDDIAVPMTEMKNQVAGSATGQIALADASQVVAEAVAAAAPADVAPAGASGAPSHEVPSAEGGAAAAAAVGSVAAASGRPPRVIGPPATAAAVRARIGGGAGASAFVRSRGAGAAAGTAAGAGASSSRRIGSVTTSLSAVWGVGTPAGGDGAGAGGVGAAVASVRSVRWNNTNELLPSGSGARGVVPGIVVDGIKTGFTPDARACLATHAVSEDASTLAGGGGEGAPSLRDELFCVTLGSKTKATRFVDNRRMLEWGWEAVKTIAEAPCG